MSFLSKLFSHKQENSQNKQSQISSPHPAKLLHIPPPSTNAHSSGTCIADRYEIAGRPLMGGMGIVYICLDRKENRPVALKTFRPEYLPDRAARDRFLREGTHWVDLGAHPHVVRCYRVLRIDPEVYLVLELVAKEQGRDDVSLRSWLTPGQPLPVEQALLFALQIARGMAHAVERIPGFVHRDLKPENILVGADRLSQTATNRLRVTDFGLAAVLQETALNIGESVSSDEPHDTRHTEHGARNPLSRTQLTHGIVGTPLYIAPEQWQGKTLTIATDVYALGCILHEMLAGQRAVTGHSLRALQRAHCAGGVRPLPTDLPEGVCALVTRCLALEPGERYRSWETVETALVTAFKEVVGHPAPAAEPMAPLSRSERVAVGWSYNAMGASYLDIGKAEVAAGYFERARGTGSIEDERRLEAAGLSHLGLAYTHLGDARRAIEFCERALAICREIDDRNGEGQVLHNLGNAHLNLGEVHQAIEFYKEALARSHEIGDWQREGASLDCLGVAYAALGDIRQAIKYREQALAIVRGIGDRHGESTALINLGAVYGVMGNARQALGCFEQALAIAREIGDREGEGKALGNLGVIYLHLGDTQRAIQCYEQRLVISRETGNRRGEGSVLNNLGEAYRSLGDVRQAIGYYEQALEIACDIGDRHGEGNALGNLGTAHLQLGDTRRAIRYYEQALAIAREINDADGVARHSFNLARLLVQQGRLAEALPYAEQAAQIVERIGHAEKARQARQFVSRIRASLR